MTETVGFQGVWTATSDQGFIVVIFDEATITDKKGQLKLMSVGQGLSVEPGTMLIRKVGKAKFD